MALGSSVLLRIEFDTDKLPAIQASATVAWCSKIERGRYRIGLQFKNLDQRSGDVIGLYRRLVNRRNESDITTRTLGDTAEMVEEVFGDDSMSLDDIVVEMKARIERATSEDERAFFVEAAASVAKSSPTSLEVSLELMLWPASEVVFDSNKA